MSIKNVINSSSKSLILMPVNNIIIYFLPQIPKTNTTPKLIWARYTYSNTNMFR